VTRARFILTLLVVALLWIACGLKAKRVFELRRDLQVRQARLKQAQAAFDKRQFQQFSLTNCSEMWAFGDAAAATITNCDVVWRFGPTSKTNTQWRGTK